MKEVTLSDPARALLSGLWGNPRFTLRYGNVDNVASAVARKALTELEAAKLIARQIGHDGAEVFSLAVDTIPVHLRAGVSFIAKHGTFPLSVPGAINEH